MNCLEPLDTRIGLGSGPTHGVTVDLGRLTALDADVVYSRHWTRMWSTHDIGRGCNGLTALDVDVVDRAFYRVSGKDWPKIS